MTNLSQAAQKFVDQAVASANDLALFFVGAPDDVMMAALERTRTNLKRELVAVLGADAAARYADEFVKTVVGTKLEIEAAGGGVAAHHYC